MRNKLGILCILTGILLLCAALSLFLHNQTESNQANLAAQDALNQVVEQMPEQIAPEDLAATLVPPEWLDPEALKMSEVEIDGHSYIGYLSIPSLELNLPILSDWDYEKLKIAPCRYAGTLLGNDLVLMAHDYPKHFGRLHELSEGDQVIFTDMDRITTTYTVVGRDLLVATAVEEMTAGEFDLTLFTCDYSGQNRVTVYCDREK